MKNKTVKEIEYKGRKLVITLFEDYIKEIETLNWYWDSLLFPNTNYVLATVEEVNSNNLLELSVNGEVQIIDKNGEKLRNTEIAEKAKNKEIESLMDNSWFENNWFEISGFFKKDDSLIYLEDSYVFEVNPKSRNELYDCLIEYYLYLFENFDADEYI